MKEFLFVITILLCSTAGRCQLNEPVIEDAITIGNINMQSVIIHVYKTKEDIYPFKEFIVMKDPNSGALQALNSKVFGKISKGGFIIVNGLKDKSEVEKLLSGEKVYDEMVVNDVEGIEAYEEVINEFIKKAILNEKEEIETEESIPNISSEVETTTSTKENETNIASEKEITNSAQKSTKKTSTSSNYKKKSKSVKSKTRIKFKPSKQRSKRLKGNRSKNGCYSF